MVVLSSSQLRRQRRHRCRARHRGIDIPYEGPSPRLRNPPGPYARGATNPTGNRHRHGRVSDVQGRPHARISNTRGLGARVSLVRRDLRDEGRGRSHYARGSHRTGRDERTVGDGCVREVGGDQDAVSREVRNIRTVGAPDASREEGNHVQDQDVVSREVRNLRAVGAPDAAQDINSLVDPDRNLPQVVAACELMPLEVAGDRQAMPLVAANADIFMPLVEAQSTRNSQLPPVEAMDLEVPPVEAPARGNLTVPLAEAPETEVPLVEAPNLDDVSLLSFPSYERTYFKVSPLEFRDPFFFLLCSDIFVSLC